MVLNVWPQLTLEVAFGYGPFDTAPVWTAIPAGRLVSLSFSDGRSKGLDDYPPAQATVVLDNFDRRYDPENTAGPHYGNLRWRTPVRAKATRNGTTYELFTMFVEGGWEQATSPPSGGTCTLQLIDILGVLQGLPLPGSPYDIEVLADAPVAYWRLDESQGSTEMVDSSPNRRDGAYDNVELGQAALLSGVGSSARFEHQGDYRGQYRARPVAAAPASIEAWVSIDRDLAYSQVLVGGYTNTGVASFLLYVAADGASGIDNKAGVLTMYTGPGVTGKQLGSSSLNIGMHHVVWCMDTATSWRLYVDGVAQTLTTTTTPTTDPWASVDRVTIGNTPDVVAGDFGLQGEMAAVAVYPTALSAARVQAHYQAGLSAWSGEMTGARADRVLDVIGVPSVYRSIDAGTTVLGPAVLSGDALAYLRKIARTELGGLFTAQHDGGKLRLPDRYERLDATRSTTPQATFSDDPAAVGAVRYEAPDLKVEPNGGASIVNQATVNWDGGSEVVAPDPGPAGPRGISIDTLSPTKAQARTLGEYIVEESSEPVTRVRGLGVLPSHDPAGWDAALGLRIGDRVTLRRKPQNIGPALTGDFWIEGRRVEVGPGTSRWHVVYGLEPVSTREWFRLDVSLLDGTAGLAY